MSAFVLNRSGYCNSLLSGYPKYLEKLQKVQNSGLRHVNEIMFYLSSQDSIGCLFQNVLSTSSQLCVIPFSPIHPFYIHVSTSSSVSWFKTALLFSVTQERHAFHIFIKTKIFLQCRTRSYVYTRQSSVE